VIESKVVTKYLTFFNISLKSWEPYFTILCNQCYLWGANFSEYHCC